MAAIGIYFGSRYVCAAVWKDGHVHIIPNENSRRTTPASQLFSENSTDVYDDARRKLGLRICRGPTVIVKKNGVEGEYFAEEVCSMVFKKLKEMAESFLGLEVTSAVITVPEEFSDFQVDGTKLAASMAGINILKLYQDPIPAVMAYNFDKQHGSGPLIIDLGSKNLRAYIVDVMDGYMYVTSNMSHTNLGGDLFHCTMVKYCVEKFKTDHGIDITSNSTSLARLEIACERAKRNLSYDKKTTIKIECLYEDIDFNHTISRLEFNALNKCHFDDFLEAVHNFWRQNGDFRLLSCVILVGGPTRMPRLQEILQGYFCKRILKYISPVEVVAYGSAVRAAVLNNDIPPRNLFEVQRLLGVYTERTVLTLGDDEYPDDYTVNALKMSKQVPINTSFEIEAMKILRNRHGFEGELILRGSRSSNHKDLKDKAIDAKLRISDCGLPYVLRTDVYTQLSDSD
ncbi:hypothetical protein ABFX02_10G060800 [Erythranthe guttata]